jgi:GNAT superfamily N-acetyltransferase
MTNAIIRAAQVSDWDQFHPFLEHDRPIDSLENAFSRFQNRLESSLHGVFVAELDAEIVGIAMAHEWDYYLMSGHKQIRFSSLYVKPEHQKKGIGKALFEFTRDWAKDNGATWFEWYASQSAIGFYERLGFLGNAQPDPENPYYEIDFSKS